MSPLPTRDKAPRPLPLTLLSAAVLLLLTACGQEIAGRLHVTPGSHYSVSGSDGSLCDDAERPVEGDEATLVGAYFSLAVDCVGEVESLAEAGIDETALPIPEGTSVSFLRFGDPGGAQPLYPGTPPTGLTATVTIGPKSWTEENAGPEPGDLYAWVGSGEPEMRVEVNDNGHVFAIDPRSGEREGVIEALYHGKLTSKQSERVPIDAEFYASDSSYEYTGAVTVFYSAAVERQVFRVEEGWLADDGKALLTVGFSWFESDEEWELVWSAGDEPDFTVEHDGEKIEPVSVEAEKATEQGSTFRDYEITYEVPPSALEFDFAFTPPQSAKWEAQGVTMSLTKGKDPVKFSLDFS
ncbi:hypothetical protein [Salininema proteolyticum]|uniref:Uncharacterized protein n=1 Tax=Salininema proteolyticum TaxID=1607685 RepID=A0ABV8U4A5_9ACTN